MSDGNFSRRLLRLNNETHLRSEDIFPIDRMHMHARRTVEHPYQIFSARMSADRGWNIKGAEGGAARMARMASPRRRRPLLPRSSQEL